MEKKKNFYDEDVTTTEAAADFFMLDDEEVDFAMSATPSMDTAAPFSLPERLCWIYSKFIKLIIIHIINEFNEQYCIFFY